MGSMVLYYFAIKGMFFFSLVRAQVKSEALSKHYIFLGFIYSLAVAFLSVTLLLSWLEDNWAMWQIQLASMLRISPWLAWIGQTFLISSFYFWLLSRFDEGIAFVILVILGIAIVLF